MNAQKLALLSLWESLWPKLRERMDANGRSIDEDIDACCTEIYQNFEKKCSKDAQAAYQKLLPKVERLLDEVVLYDEANKDDPMFTYWRHNLELVGDLLCFTRAIREGDWLLYLSTLAKMLPLFSEFDHTNHVRWGTAFLTDMKFLKSTAPDVYAGFMNGDFVLKETDNKYNQIANDHVEHVEHVNRKSKAGRELVGILHSEAARTKWSNM